MVKITKTEYQRKIRYAKHVRRTKWAPFWTVVKKFGKGKRVHPSFMTRIKRNWRRNKLRIKPYTDRRRHYRD